MRTFSSAATSYLVLNQFIFFSLPYLKNNNKATQVVTKSIVSCKKKQKQQKKTV